MGTGVQSEVDRQCTAVIGGLRDADSADDASTWVKDKLWQMWGPQPVEVYCKGDFRSVMFAKFSSKTDRDSAVVLLKQAGGVWAKADQPIEVRAKASLAFGLKFLLHDKWGYEKYAIWADPESGSVWLGDDMVLQSVSVGEGALKVTYGEGWEPWLQDDNYPEFNALVSTLNSKLSNVASKGVGKTASKGVYGGKGN